MSLSETSHWLDSLEIGRLRDGALDFLPRSFDPAVGRCSFKAEWIDDSLVQDWASPWSTRYTINSLLGLHAAGHPDAEAMTQRFLAVNAVANPADLGLLTVLHCLRGDDDAAARIVPRLASLAGAGPELQELAWLLWGASAATRAGLEGAEHAARTLLDRILTDYVDGRTAMPRHTLRLHRRRILSFGGLVYFLRAMEEAADALHDAHALAAFERGVEAALTLQGPLGEWPWMIDVERGRAFDRYPVFSVHQDSMAMLFLLPAVDRGLDVSEAIERSVRWVHGENELGLRFYEEDPFFFAYRAIERREALTKARRYGRWATRARARQARERRLRVNRECRSYHLGWILYAWA